VFTLTLFTDYRFDTLQKSVEFLTLLNTAESMFAPVRFGEGEPVRRKFEEHNLDEPSKILSGYPDYQGGGLLIKGAKYKYLAVFRWKASGLAAWNIYLSDQLFDRPERGERFLRFVAALCERYTIAYGYGASDEDWNATHWLYEETPNGGVSQKRVQYDMERCLPGPYWLTMFGQPLIEYFGREKIERLPSHLIMNMGQKNIAVLLSNSPFEPSLEERLRQSAKIASQLGSGYFFDINDIGKACRPILGITSGGAPDDSLLADLSNQAVRQASTQPSSSMDAQEFEQRDVLQPEGVDGVPGPPYTDPTDLADGIPIGLQEDIHVVLRYTRSDLERLDAHFSTHPPTREFKPNFLLNDFVPALGAYLGTVLAREADGEWIVCEPIMKSRILLQGEEIDPFWIAYRIVYEGGSFLEAFDRLINRTTDGQENMEH